MEVIGTHGAVNIEITGIAETIRMLQRYRKFIPDKTNISLIQAADHIKQEVQESIIGNREETRSVDTGNLANSIEVKPEGNGLAVFTDVDYAQFLEYGTSRIAPRMHFRNTKFREEPKVKEIFKANLNFKGI